MIATLVLHLLSVSFLTEKNSSMQLTSCTAKYVALALQSTNLEVHVALQAFLSTDHLEQIKYCTVVIKLVVQPTTLAHVFHEIVVSVGSW